MIEEWDEDTAPRAANLRMEAAQAIFFLTRIPLKIEDGSRLPPLSQAARAFGLAGALAGLIAGVAGAVAFHLGLGSFVAASVALAAGILATGALHEDGLADMADGFWGGHTIQRKLAIMRDSRIGSYGVLALGLALLIRAGLLAAILQHGGAISLILLMAGAGAISRALMVPLMAHLPAARPDGLSASAGVPEKPVVQQALALGGGLALVLFWAGAGLFAGLLALILAAAAAYGVSRLALAHIGGQTGDVCGALSVLSEMAALAGLVMLLAAN
jgi:adenosylcobinamide-GDP ribazoletransferase